MANERIKVAMTKADMTQTELADLLGMSQGALSMMLKFELSAKVQNDIVAQIREHAKKGE